MNLAISSWFFLGGDRDRFFSTGESMDVITKFGTTEDGELHSRTSGS